MKSKPIIAIDIETTGINPEKCETIELAAVVISTSMEKVDTFQSLLRPLKPENADPKAMDVHKIPMDELLKAPHPKAVWQDFVNFVSQYNSGGNKWGKPYVTGYNIDRFDLPFLQNTLIKEYGPKENMFDVRQLDMLSTIWFWFENNHDITSISFPKLRSYFGLDSKDTHRALKDADQEADIFIRLVNLHRTVAQKVRWK